MKNQRVTMKLTLTMSRLLINELKIYDFNVIKDKSHENQYVFLNRHCYNLIRYIG